MAINEACKEAVWLKGLFAELCGDDSCIKLFCDNQSAIYLTKDQMFHERTKHIDIKYHYVRDVVARGKLQVCNISTHGNPADMMTKPVPVAKFELCSSLVGITVSQVTVWRQQVFPLFVQEIVEVHATRNLSQGGVCYMLI
jgi:hypothetical protein